MKFRNCVTSKENLKLYVDENPKVAKIKLDLTTNPLGFPKRVLSSLSSLNETELSRYNEPPELPELKKAIVKHSGIAEEQIMITSGADQAIEIVLTHILEKGDVLGIHIPTFPRFEIVARRLCDARIKFFTNISDIPIDCKAVVFCTPNNPTTKEIKISELEKVAVANKNKFIIIDAVFSDFGKNKISSLVGKFENVIVLKSLSKSFGLPGIRVGWIESQNGNIKVLREGVSPFRVPFVCQKIALEAMKDSEHITKTKDFLSKEFAKIKGEFNSKVVRESEVPFFLFEIENPQKAREWLFEQDISVVDSTSFKGTDNGFLRIMIGKEEENKILIEKLKQLLKRFAT